MDKKVIFLDIDGTLVNHGDYMSPKVKEALQAVRKNGHYIFLCTGRNRAGVRQLLDLGLFDGTVSSAGGYIEIYNEVIYQAGMNKEDVAYAMKVLDKYKVLYNLEANYKTFQDDEMSKTMVNIFGGSNSEADRLIEQAERFNIYPLKDYHDEIIQTICFIALDESSVDTIKPLLSNRFDMVIYSKLADKYSNGELMRKGIHKGMGIMKVMDALNIDISHSIGFGDSMNDLDMLKTCGYSVVMANGDEYLKSFCDSVCESIEDDGIYYELKRLHLFK